MKTMVLTSSILILLLALLRYLLRGRISLRLQYALWLLVAVRLLIPFELGQSALSVLSLANLAEETPAVKAVQSIGEFSMPAQSFEDAYAQVAEEYASQGIDVSSLTGSEREALDYEAQSRMAGPTLAELAADAAPKLWLAGAGLMALWFLGVNLRLRRKLRKAAEPVSIPDCPLPVHVVPGLPSPCLFGLPRPAVYLTPACLESQERLRHVTAHELTHYRHGDPWWALVRCACLCLHWFNPLVWWAASLSRRDCELACDEGTLARLGEDQRLAYGRTLVDMVAVGISPSGLLQTATTMQSGQKSLKERIVLIAKRPRMLAATAVCLVLAVAAAVGCTFTGAERSLREQLNGLPEEYLSKVTLMDLETLPEGTLMTAYYAPDYDGDYGGWLFDVSEWTQADFEKHLCAVDTSGEFCFARDGERYYAIHVPTDVRFSPENQKDYDSTQTSLLEWAEATVLAHRGVESYGEAEISAIRNAPFYYEGSHIDATYWPYYALDGSKDTAWTFVLSQPVTQGDGGIWCVERWRGEGEYPETWLVRPDTDLPSAEYYADLQAQADKGLADWALDPMEVCLRYAYTFEGAHLNATADSFSLGQVYSALPGSANEQAEEELDALLQNNSGMVVFDLELRQSSIWSTRSVTLSSGDASLQTLLSALTENYDWVDTHWDWPLATDPWADENLEYFFHIHDQHSNYSLSLYAGGSYLSYSRAGFDANYQVTPKTGDQGMAEFVRVWFDAAYAAKEKTAAEEAQLLLDEIAAGDALAMTLTTADSQGGGRYETTVSGSSNGAYTLYHLTDGEYFRWYRAEGGQPSTLSADSLTLESADGTRAVQLWSGSEQVRCTREGETFWLRAESTGQDIFASSIFQFLRFWYDEAELDALSEEAAIPDRGQSRLEIAQEWVDSRNNVTLHLTPGSKFANTYVRSIVEINEDAYENWFQDNMLETEHFYFSYYCIFVPENEWSYHWQMAGNTGDYEGEYGEAPAGAQIAWRMGPMYLAEDGWRCGGIGTGP